MTRITFLNGQFIEHENAKIHIEDRSIQFADSVYEVILFHKNKLVDGLQHWQRLENSLAKLGMKMPYSIAEFDDYANQLFNSNKLETASIYIQVTRGVCPRSQLIPQDIPQTVIMTVSPFKVPSTDLNKTTKAMLEPDIRWHMCDVKSTGLLIGSLYKQKAADNGCDDVIMHRDGNITECCFSNIFIVKNNELITHPTDNLILAGITRATIIELAKKLNISIIERKFNIAELLNADEVFSTSTTTFVRPIHITNDKIIADGKTGNIAQSLFNSYINYINQ